MKQTSSLTRNLAAAQDIGGETSSPAFNAAKTLYRLYTQFLPDVDVRSIVQRYFAGATLYYGVGLDARTRDAAEESLTIEIVSSLPDALQSVLFLAGDLRIVGKQISVLVTVQPIRTFEITAEESTQIAPRPALDCASDSPRYNRDSKAQAHRFSGI